MKLRGLLSLLALLVSVFAYVQLGGPAPYTVVWQGPDPERFVASTEVLGGGLARGGGLADVSLEGDAPRAVKLVWASYRAAVSVLDDSSPQVSARIYRLWWDCSRTPPPPEGEAATNGVVYCTALP